MSDELTNDAIAQLLIDARRTSYTLRPGGEKRVTLTLACVDLLCHEMLRLRQEVATLRAERAAAVAAERERCAEVADRQQKDCIARSHKVGKKGYSTVPDGYAAAMCMAIADAIRRGE